MSRWYLALLLCAGCSFSITLTGDAGGGDDDDGGGPGSDGTIDTPPTPWLAGWRYRKPIRIHANQIDGPVADFPVAIALDDSDVDMHALADRTDLAFTAADATTPLAHELEAVENAAALAWVKVPALDPSADTTIYLYYGNATPPATTASAVWTGGFHAVFHLQQDPGPGGDGEIRDATANGRDGTARNLVAGDLHESPRGRAIDFNGSNSCISVPAFDLGATFTIAVWMNMNSVSQIRTLFTNSEDGSNTNGIRFFVNSNGSSDRKVLVETGNGGSTNLASTATNAITTGVWRHVVAVVDRTAGTASIIVDGMVVSTDMSIRNDFSTNHAMEIARMETNNPFDGFLDDVQISSVARPLAWIRTAYNNQREDSTFYELGAEQALP